MEEKKQESPRMNFKDYYEGLPMQMKLALRDKLVPKYLPQSTFYDKIAGRNWDELGYEKLEEFTGINFRPIKIEEACKE